MQSGLRWGGGRAVVGASRSLRALHAAACRPRGVLALWLMSGALRIALVSGFAVHLVLAPAHPWGLLASQRRPRGLPVRPPWGLPENRADHAKPLPALAAPDRPITHRLCRWPEVAAQS